MRSALALCCSLLCSLAFCPAAFAQGAHPQAAMPPEAASRIADPAAFVALQFGPSYKVDPKFPPLFGDLDGDGDEDVVLFATSPTPLLSEEQFQFKVEDPYDGYFGTGDPKITTQLELHFDGSGRDILIVFGWRLPPTAHKSKHRSKTVSKYVLINTPMQTVSLAPLRLKKKDMQAIETADHTGQHALLVYDGRQWRWSAQGSDDDDPLQSDNK